MAVTVTPPLPAPTVALSLVSGGTLDASTTYYVRVTAADASNYGLAANPGALGSPACAELSITTDAVNKSILVTITADGYKSHNVYVTKISGDYSGYSRCGAGNFYSTLNNSETSYTIIAPPSQPVFDSFAQASSLPTGLSKADGYLTVNATGSITLQDIYDQIVADGYGSYVFYDGKTFNLKGSLYITGSTAGDLTIKNKVINMYGMDNTNVNFIITIGEWDATNSRAYNGCTMFFWGNSGYIAARTQLALYGCIIKAGGGLDIYTAPVSNYDSQVVGKLTNINVYDTDKFLQNNFDNGIRIFPYVDLTNFKNYNYTNSGAGVDINADVSVSDFTLIYTYVWLRPNRNAVVTDAYIQNTNGSDGHFKIHETAGNTGSLKIVNGTFVTQTYINDVPTGMPAFYPYATSDAPTITIYKSIALKIIDKDGNVISGATIKIEDKDGAITGSPFTTDVNGEISSEIKIYDVTQKGAIDVHQWFDYTGTSPHKIAISKSGYKSYQTTQNIVDKVDWIIRLEKVLDSNFSKRVSFNTQ